MYDVLVYDVDDLPPKMSHGGWGGGLRKVPKKCHILLEWPIPYPCRGPLFQLNFIFFEVCPFEVCHLTLQVKKCLTFKNNFVEVTERNHG